MHQQGFYGVTGARTLGFSVDDNLQRRSYLSSIINIDMTNANAAGDNRDRRLLTAQLMQTRATAWDQHIDVLIHTQHFSDQRAIRVINRLHGGGG